MYKNVKYYVIFLFSAPEKLQFLNICMACRFYFLSAFQFSLFSDHFLGLGGGGEKDFVAKNFTSKLRCLTTWMFKPWFLYRHYRFFLEADLLQGSTFIYKCMVTE
jgi:hypothetical protein